MNTKQMLFEKLEVLTQLEEMIKGIQTTSEKYMEINDKF